MRVEACEGGGRRRLHHSDSQAAGRAARGQQAACSRTEIRILAQAQPAGTVLFRKHIMYHSDSVTDDPLSTVFCMYIACSVYLSVSCFLELDARAETVAVIKP